MLVGRSGHSAVEISGCVDELLDAVACLLDHRCGDALDAGHRRLSAAPSALFPGGAATLRRALTASGRTLPRRRLAATRLASRSTTPALRAARRRAAALSRSGRPRPFAARTSTAT